MSEKELEALNRQLAELMGQHNNEARADFANLNSHQVHLLLYAPLETGCVVQWQNNLPQEDLKEIPFLRLSRLLLQRLAEKEVKLTAKGNLPRALVLQLAEVIINVEALKDAKTLSEDDLPVISGLKFILGLAGYTKKRNGKLSLTAKGTKMLQADPAILCKTLFQLAFTKYNLEYAANSYIPEEAHADGRLQRFTGFVLYLLLKNGRDWRATEDYVSDLLRAFPKIRQDFPGSARFPTEFLVHYSFMRTYCYSLLEWFGLARIRKAESANNTRANLEIMATDRFRCFFCIVPAA